MSKSSKRNNVGKAARQVGKEASPAEARETLSPSEKVAREDLGDFVGIVMDEKPKDSKKDAKADVPDEELVLTVGEDRTRLALQGVAYLLLAFFGLFLVAGGVGATQITLNIAYLTLVLVGLPLAWFASKAMGRRFGRLFTRVNVADFGEQHIFIYDKADSKKAKVVSYKDVKSYKLIRQGNALRLLLSGDWVTHPSGFYFVDINRPFMADTLDGLEGEILEVLRSHHVKQAKK